MFINIWCGDIHMSFDDMNISGDNINILRGNYYIQCDAISTCCGKIDI